MNVANRVAGVEGFEVGRRGRRSGRTGDLPSLAIRDLPVWDSEEMRFALRHRGIAQVYKLLQRHGVSQRRLAASTGQSQSEISDILAGRRVNAYDVLIRIADGLSVPRGWLGLAHVDVDAKPTEVEFEMARIEALFAA